MPYLQRAKVRPQPDDLPPAEARSIAKRFDPYAGEVLVDGQAVGWNEIEEIEVVVAPRAAGPAGWLVRYLVHGEERYHIGIYFGRQEAVLPNVRLTIVKYVLECIAFYAPLPIAYKGPADLVPLIEEPTPR